ncbi:MAG: dihydroorotase [Flavisolibacter sp.]
MQKYLIKNINVVNEEIIKNADILIANERIEKIGSTLNVNYKVTEIDGNGKYLFPGLIDDQVHFRQPGLTHKATIYTEAKAGIAGGVTSFMEMPNTVPPVFTQKLLENKYDLAKEYSLANYSFYMGTSHDNIEQVLATNKKKHEVCGIKIFMGSSTGNLLVDNYLILDRIFSESELLIATHCEDEDIIKKNLLKIQSEKKVLEPSDHPLIRSEEACFESSFKAVQFAKKHNSRLHVLHISTEKELQLFSNMLPLKDKKITAEVCVHHLHFTSEDYPHYGNLIKCNPAIKAPFNRNALWKGMLEDQLDVIATDHAPHTWLEKNATYEKAHSGMPLVQHSFLLMLEYSKTGKIRLETIASKMSHAVAQCFKVKERGYIREGYYADLVVVDMNSETGVNKQNILYKCGWSPFEGHGFPAAITHTFVNGNLVFDNGRWDESNQGKRLGFKIS